MQRRDRLSAIATLLLIYVRTYMKVTWPTLNSQSLPFFLMRVLTCTPLVRADSADENHTPTHSLAQLVHHPDLQTRPSFDCNYINSRVRLPCPFLYGHYVISKVMFVSV